MKSFIKIVIVFGVFIFFAAYGFADKIETESSYQEKRTSIQSNISGKKIYDRYEDKISKEKKVSSKTLEKKEKEEDNDRSSTQKDNISCDQKQGFKQKIEDIQQTVLQKTALLQTLDTSLEQLIPLLSKSSIKTSLQKKQKSVQAIKNKYVALNIRLQTNPQVFCEKGFVWKSYNEETKEVIASIRKQFSLLKK